MSKINVNLQTLPIEKVRPNPWNPNRQSDFIFDKERTSIRTHGFIDPVLVRQKGDYVEIIDGEHRWRAAQMEGLTEIPVNNLGEVPDVVAKQLTIIMNEVKGNADKDELSKLIKDLNASIDTVDLLTHLPFTEMELNKLLSDAAINWDEVTNQQQNIASTEDFTIFQVKLKNETHQQLMFQINRLKLQMNPGGDPNDVALSEVLEQIVKLLIPIADENLVTR